MSLGEVIISIELFLILWILLGSFLGIGKRH